MLVSHRHRFIYTKTLKTAGTSVEAYFEKYCLLDPTAPMLELRGEEVSEAGIVGARSLAANGKRNEWWNHMPVAQIREKLGDAMFESYFKFCCIRNPYDKALSAYFWYDGIGQMDVPKDLPDPERFERWMVEKGPPGDRNKYVIKGQFCLDDVIRYETLAADVERICAKLGLPWEPDRVPSFKKGIRPEGRGFAAMYTPGARRAVEEKYAWELAYFGYRFPEEPNAVAA